MSNSDVLDMEARLRVVEPFIVIHSISERGVPSILEEARSEKDGREWLYYFLARPNDVGPIKMRHVPSRGYWVVDSVESPVIEFSKCFADDRVMRRGRMYCTNSYYDADGNLVSKGEGFESWGKKVFSVAKKGLIRDGADYFGKGALAWKDLAGGDFEM